MARHRGLENVYLDGSEMLTQSKFTLIVDILKRRIVDEQKTYNDNEIKEATQLLKLADSFNLLFTAQDTPLYYTQNSIYINSLANHLMAEVQEPLTFEELPHEEKNNCQRTFVSLHNEVQIRDNLLNEFVNGEIFINNIDYINQFDLNCLLGLNNIVWQDLENLAEFNLMITRRFNLMHSLVEGDNMIKVNYVLSYIDNLIAMHAAKYPEQAKKRMGDFEAILNDV